jgi:hypothetical protein
MSALILNARYRVGPATYDFTDARVVQKRAAVMRLADELTASLEGLPEPCAPASARVVPFHRQGI